MSAGYASMSVGGRKVSGHRVAWELYRGPIQPGLCVLHKCDVPSCVNPKHLFLGTQVDNIADMDKKGRRRAARGERHGSARLTWAEVERIRGREGTLRAIGMEFGVSTVTAWRIRHGLIWKAQMPTPAGISQAGA